MEWTGADDQKLKALTAEGYSASRIGRAMGRSRNAVLGRLFRLGQKAGQPPNQPGVDAATAARIAKLNGDGLNYNEIAVRLGLSPGVVRKAGKAMGLTAARHRAASDAAIKSRLARKTERREPMGRETAPDTALFLRFTEGYRGQTGRIDITGLNAENCHFPIDQAEGPVRFCGAVAEAGSSWCAEHGQRCLNGVPAPKQPVAAYTGRRVL